MSGAAERTDAGRQRLFWAAYLLIAAVSVLREAEYGVHGMNAGTYALSWRYGFLPRGALGSLLLGLARLGGEGVYRPTTVFILSVLWLAVYAFLLFGIARKLVAAYPKSDSLKILVLALLPFFLRMFLTAENFGRTDVLLLVLTIFSCLFIIHGRGLWLVPLFCALAMTIHQNYIFTYFSILPALLFYRGTKQREAGDLAWRWSACVMLLSVVVTVGLLFWFQFFCHRMVAVPEAAYVETMERVEQLVLYDTEIAVNESFIYREMYGGGSLMEEWRIVVREMGELLIFCVLCIPFLLPAREFLRRTIRYGAPRWRVYLLCAGSLAILPDLLLKCDYGRWVYAVFVYYILLVAFLLLMGDAAVEQALHECVQGLKKSWYGAFLLLYLMTILPMKSVAISRVSHRILETILLLWSRLSGG